ncbi:MAG TPA: hypothetical protein VHO90_11800 [Bacteroidales bacterium]|nr:hypothetical protein [Bacteroidales bacterium]
MREKDNNYTEQEELPGYPVYPEGEDIYNVEAKEEEIDPDRIADRILPNLSDNTDAVGLDDYDVVGSELDIPGTELDDIQESLGTEDEENNYYSLGGDNHESLEEDNEGM